MMLLPALSLLLPLQQVVERPPRQKNQLRLHVEALELAEAQGRFPMLSRDGAGKVHMGWLSEEDERVLLQHAVWDGTAWSKPHAVAQGTGWLVNWADFAKLQVDAEGAAIAAWQAFAADGKGYGVMFQRRREAGAAWTDPRPLHRDREAVEHGFVSLAPIGSGRFFANWLQSTADGPPTALRGVVVEADGQPGEEFVLDPLVCDCCGTASAALPNGDVVIAYRGRTEDEVRDIRVLRGNPEDPAGWGEPLRVGLESWKTASCPVNGPALAQDGAVLLLTYYTEIQEGTGMVRFLFSRNGGKRFGVPGALAGGAHVMGRVAAAFLPGEKGPVVVSWLERDGEDAVWKACGVPRRGKPGPTVEIARVPGGRADGFLQLAAGPNSVIAAWTDVDGGVVRTARIRELHEVKAGALEEAASE